MKKILLFCTILLVAMSISAQESAVSDTLQAANDSLSIGSHTEFSAASIDENATKAQADSAYMKNDYTTAIQLYEALLKKGESSEVYYNLGNSHYKADNIAKAILNYERALLLQPGNADIRANLDIARAKTVDKVVPIPEIFFITWAKSLVNTFNVDTWAKMGIFFFILFLVSLSLFFIAKRSSLKKMGFIGGLASFVFLVISNVSASQQKSALINRNDAIVLSPSVTVRSTPSESGTSLFILHEGRRLEIKDGSMREWKEIRLEDGKVGWVPASSIEVI